MPCVPACFGGGSLGLHIGAVPKPQADALFVSSMLPCISAAVSPRLEVTAVREDAGRGRDLMAAGQKICMPPKLTIGVLFCGRQCPGAHNVVVGLSQFLATHVVGGGRLLGFVEGTVSTRFVRSHLVR